MIGKTFGRLTVIGELPRYISPSGVSLRVWECRCICGNVVKRKTGNLSAKVVRSCGCYAGQHSRTHGLTTIGAKRPPEYETWIGMRRRCSDSSRPDFKHYGARGIRVCEAWDDFETFLADMGPRPGKGYSVERKNNNGNYEPSNCKWGTPTEQSRNRRFTKITKKIADEIRQLRPDVSGAELARRYGVSDATISMVCSGVLWK